jgi:hypothetical protein
MTILGWFEVLARAAAGCLWVLARFGIAPRESADAGAPDWRSWHLRALVAVGVGLLTLRAASAFRRVPGAAEPPTEAVAGAVERLKDLYEAQVGLLLFVVLVTVLALL